MKTSYLILEAERPLGETAEVLGQVLGVSFSKEVMGKFEEYPAYVARGVGISFALLGIPSSECDLRDDSANTYELQVGSERSDAREQAIGMLAAEPRIKVVA